MSQNEEETTPLHLYIPPHRIVHLDLKGAPPSIDYIKKILTMSKRLGATGVLVEWEDMFPWSGR
jgi:hexosaminidase